MADIAVDIRDGYRLLYIGARSKLAFMHNDDELIGLMVPVRCRYEEFAFGFILSSFCMQVWRYIEGVEADPPRAAVVVMKDDCQRKLNMKATVIENVCIAAEITTPLVN
jgi:hypothetical protein